MSVDVAPPMPEGLNVVASRHLEMADGRYPVAWVDDRGNVLPVEKHMPLSILPPGCEYLFTEGDVQAAMSRSKIVMPVATINSVQALRQATGLEEPARPNEKTDAHRAQALSAFNSVLGSPTHMVR